MYVNYEIINGSDYNFVIVEILLLNVSGNRLLELHGILFVSAWCQTILPLLCKNFTVSSSDW